MATDEATANLVLLPWANRMELVRLRVYGIGEVARWPWPRYGEETSSRGPTARYKQRAAMLLT